MERQRRSTVEDLRLRSLLRRSPSRPRWLLVAVLAVSLGAAVWFAVAVPAGAPYDEPAHWSNVEHYRVERSLPVLGDPGVGYEAQMGPVYYVGAAVVDAALTPFSPEVRFHGVRLVGALLVPLTALLAWWLALLVRPPGGDRSGGDADRRWLAAVWAAAVVGLNPALLAIGASVQNDTVTIVLASLVAALAIRWLREDQQAGDGGAPPARLVRWALLGALCGLVVLTKVFAGGVVVGVLVALAVRWWRGGRPVRAVALRRALAVVVALVVTVGWWVVRNLVVYGEPTGRGGLADAGFEFPRRAYEGVGSVAGWARSSVTNVWLPTEYYRNVFEAPLVVRAAVTAASVLVAAAVVVAVVRRGRELRPTPVIALLASWTAVTVLAWALITWTSTALAVRVTFPLVPALAGVLAAVVFDGGSRGIPRRLGQVTAIVTVVVVVGTTLWTMSEVATLARQPFWIPL